MVQRSDLWFVQRWSTSGKVGFVGGDPGAPTIDLGVILVLVTDTRPEYTFCQRSTGPPRAYLDSPASATAIPVLSQEELGNTSVLLPQLGVQRGIVTLINQHCAGLDTASREVLPSLARLREYRQALVTAAVIGRVAVAVSEGP